MIRRATTKEKIAIWEILKEELEETGDGFVRYKRSGVDDAEVAKRVGVKAKRSVELVRLEMFGQLRKARTGKTKEKIEDVALATLAIAESVSDLSTRFDKLLDNLTLNRVIDVKHLKCGKRAGEASGEK